MFQIDFELGLMKAWKRLLNETENPEKQSRERPMVKLSAEKLKVYIEKPPDAMLSDITKNLGKLALGAFDALKYIKIS